MCISLIFITLAKNLIFMKLYNELKLRFDTPIWGLHPELALFDILMDKNPHFVKLVSNDVILGLKESSFGRKDSPTVEQVLRAAIYKEIKRLTYRELEINMIAISEGIETVEINQK